MDPDDCSDNVLPQGAGAVSPNARKLEEQEVLAEAAWGNILYRTLSFQGFLVQFMNPSVRRAFLDGYFCVPHNTDDVLKSLDLIREMMFPHPLSTTDGTRSEIAVAGVTFFSKLLTRREAEPVDLHGYALPFAMSYKAWANYMETLMQNPYWESSNTGTFAVRSKHSSGEQATKCQESRKVEKTRDSSVLRGFEADAWEGSVPASGFGKVNIEMISNCQRASPDAYVTKCQGPRPRQKKEPGDNRRDKPKGKWHDTNDAPVSSRPRYPSKKTRSGRSSVSCSESDSDSSTASSPSEWDTDSSDRADIRRRKKNPGKRDLISVLKRISYPKDVVNPGVFDGEEGNSLKTFLTEYEDYFTIKYDGTELQKSKQLEQFLGGRAKQAFDAMGGSKLKYYKLKPKLLTWYKSEKSSLRAHSEAEFEKAKMHQGDTFQIYALRLERLAREAFPDSKREQERQLCKKMWKSAPRSFYKALADGERSMGLVGERKKLNWKSILRLAETEDRHQRYGRKETREVHEVEDPNLSIWYSQPDPARFSPQDNQFSRPLSSWRPSATERMPPRHIYYNSNYRSPVKQDARTNLPPTQDVRGHPVPDVFAKTRNVSTCNWCGRRGHLESSCWIKNGACLICGSNNHDKEQCDTFGDGRGNFNPTCSRCSGTHLGKNCPTARQSN
jgi:hypothetical protein